MKLFMTVGVIISLAASSGAQPVSLSGKSEVSKKHEVSKGETLWGLSDKYYGNPFKWGKIYNANLDRIANPDLIYPNDEITIPEITETVMPVPEETAELYTEKAADTASVSVGEVSSPAVAKVKAPNFEPMEPSMEMPADQREWAAGPATVVPKNWKADGVIISRINDGTDEDNDSLTVPGDRVRIKVRKPALFRPGEIISAYIMGATAYDKKTNKKLGRELQKTGNLEVLSVKKNIVKARVIKSNTSVDSGQVIKR
ncbi:MAG: LysM peptidoglycan-binding domain-containing protein [Elusimicrobiota bacterium]